MRKRPPEKQSLSRAGFDAGVETIAAHLAIDTTITKVPQCR